MVTPSVVLIHKVPASWESEAKAQKSLVRESEKEINKIENPNDDEISFLENLEKDLFFRLAHSISDYLGLNDINVILGYDSKEKRNWEIISREGKINFQNILNFYSISSPDRIPQISEGSILILRGNYPFFHNQVIELLRPSLTIFYPATSLFFPLLKKRLENLKPLSSSGELSEKDIAYYVEMLSDQSVFSSVETPVMRDDLTNLEFRRSFNNFIDSCILISDRIRERESPGKYDLVLFDEKANMDTLGKRHPNSQLLQFNKSYSDSFNLEINSNRVFDLIFTGTSIQKTKNHELFYSIIDSIIQKNPDLRVAIVGIQSEGEKLHKRWKKSNVEIFDRVGKNQLSNLFNKSRFHIITSSRDCFPRTIPESLVCGCHILTLDLLSDGLSLIEENPILGSIIDTSGARFSLENGYSLSVNVSDYITNQITSQISVSRDPLLISALASELFPIHKMVQMDLIWQAADLNLNFQFPEPNH